MCVILAQHDTTIWVGSVFLILRKTSVPWKWFLGALQVACKLFPQAPWQQAPQLHIQITWWQRQDSSLSKYWRKAFIPWIDFFGSQCQHIFNQNIFCTPCSGICRLYYCNLQTVLLFTRGSVYLLAKAERHHTHYSLLLYLI